MVDEVAHIRFEAVVDIGMRIWGDGRQVIDATFTCDVTELFGLAAYLAFAL